MHLLGFVSPEMIDKKTVFNRMDIQKTDKFPYFTNKSFFRSGNYETLFKIAYLNIIDSNIDSLKELCTGITSIHKIEIKNNYLNTKSCYELFRIYLDIVQIAKRYATYEPSFNCYYAYFVEQLTNLLDKIYTIDNNSAALFSDRNLQIKKVNSTENYIKNPGDNSYSLLSKYDKNTIIEGLQAVHNYLSVQFNAEMMNITTSDCFYSNRVGRSYLVIDFETSSLFSYPWSGNFETDSISNFNHAEQLDLFKEANDLSNELTIAKDEIQDSIYKLANGKPFDSQEVNDILVMAAAQELAEAKQKVINSINILDSTTVKTNRDLEQKTHKITSNFSDIPEKLIKIDKDATSIQDSIYKLANGKPFDSQESNGISVFTTAQKFIQETQKVINSIKNLDSITVKANRDIKQKTDKITSDLSNVSEKLLKIDEDASSMEDVKEKNIKYKHPFLDEIKGKSKAYKAVIWALDNDIFKIEGDKINYNGPRGHIHGFFQDCKLRNWDIVRTFITCDHTLICNYDIAHTSIHESYYENLQKYAFPELYHDPKPSHLP